jgi:hypothetical protein
MGASSLAALPNVGFKCGLCGETAYEGITECEPALVNKYFLHRLKITDTRLSPNTTVVAMTSSVISIEPANTICSVPSYKGF